MPKKIMSSMAKRMALKIVSYRSDGTEVKQRLLKEKEYHRPKPMTIDAMIRSFRGLPKGLPEDGF
jgi:hypothetical protein